MAIDRREQLERSLGTTYSLDRELVAGGMARVFVATDTTLGRKVVAKVLRSDITHELSAERFKREIQLAARLQHPHIVPLLTAGALDDGALYYTMPLVDGETLRQHIERYGSVPIDEVIHIMRAVASALSYAHEHSVVHRDIKPENILVSHGVAMVTDFGIAKAIHAARASTDEVTSRSLTAAGTSLGTPAYMAPEQAAGDAVDHRSDLYSLGVVAYEMLAGRRPFDGRSAHQVIAAHVSIRPEPIAELRPNTPVSLAALVMRLLEKNPADRPQSADEMIRELDDAARRRSGTKTRRRINPIATAAGAAVVLVIGVLAWLTGPPVRQTKPALRARLALELPPDARLNAGAGFGNSMVFSPDGQTLVYVGGGPVSRLYARRLDELTARPIAGTEGALNPQFSPDGREIGFVDNLALRAVPIGGGTPRVIARGIGRFTWGPNGIIVFSRPSVLSPRGGLWRVSASGGTPVELTHPDTTLRRFHGSPMFVPDGRAVLFSSRPGSGNPTLMAVRLADGVVVPLNVIGGSPLYVRDHLVFTRNDGTLAAVRFDAGALKVIGEPVTLLDNVALKSGGAAEIALSSTGTLAYLSGTIGQQLVDLDRRGTSKLVLSKVGSYREPRVSPDGRRVALTIGPPPYNSDIWIYDIASGTLTRLTTGGTSVSAWWSPDGSRIAWTSIGQPNATGATTGNGGVWWQPWDASAPPALLVPGVEGGKFTRSGDSLITNFDVPEGTEVRLVPLPYDARRTAAVLLPAQPEPRQARLSPDGKWLAYVSDQTGTREVFIQPFPTPAGHYQISSGSGTEPVWSPSGRTLTYRSGAAMVEATIATVPSVTVIRRDTLFIADMALSVVEAMYDVAPNGHFVLIKTVPNVTPPIIVFGWADEVRERLEDARRTSRR